eukprot:m.62677 g.62677  ORF g.62677 m.62677 type:complete len:54 (+) comp35096_c0_seq2:52-213(+)
MIMPAIVGYQPVVATAAVVACGGGGGDGAKCVETGNLPCSPKPACVAAETVIR